MHIFHWLTSTAHLSYFEHFAAIFYMDCRKKITDVHCRDNDDVDADDDDMIYILRH